MHSVKVQVIVFVHNAALIIIVRWQALSRLGLVVL